MIDAGVRAAMQIESVLGELADAKEAPLRRLVACDPETNPSSCFSWPRIRIPLSDVH